MRCVHVGLAQPEYYILSTARILWLLQWRHEGCDGVSDHQPRDCLLKRLFRHKSKKISKLRVTGLCAGNSPVTGEFLAQMASNTENVSIWWRHHDGMWANKYCPNEITRIFDFANDTKCFIIRVWLCLSILSMWQTFQHNLTNIYCMWNISWYTLNQPFRVCAFKFYVFLNFGNCVESHQCRNSSKQLMPSVPKPVSLLNMKDTVYI